MSNIYRGSISEKEVSDYIGEPVTTAYAKYQNGPTNTFYEYGDSIKHPDTGEKLQATKGFVNPKNSYQCYYAEYVNDKGQSFYYFDKKDIGKQRYEDEKLYNANKVEKQNKDEDNKREKFFEENKMLAQNNSSQSKREKFFDESKGNDEQQRSSMENSLNNYQSNGR